MLPKEVLQKIRRIQISTSRMVTDVFSGQYHSVFKGRGMEFDEVREYQPGDDVRSIDWNVTARMGHPFIKKFVEERELTVLLLLDKSASCAFGTVQQLKNQRAAEVCSVLAFSAIRNNDKVGLVLFTDHIEKFIPPRKGTSHVLRVIREALYFTPRGRGTDIGAALEYLNHTARRRSVVFVISDFLSADYKKMLSVANKRHDVVALTITDPLELRLPDVGLVTLDDPETGGSMTVDTSSPAFRRHYEENAALRLKKRSELFRNCAVDSIDISTGTDYARSLFTFFRQRERRMRWAG